VYSKIKWAVPVISMLDNRIIERILQRCLGGPTAKLRKSWEDAMRLDDAIFLNMTNGRPAARLRVIGVRKQERSWPLKGLRSRGKRTVIS